MEAEFVNAYIETQKRVLDDYLTRILILETKNRLLEEKNAGLMQELKAKTPVTKIKGD